MDITCSLATLICLYAGYAQQPLINKHDDDDDDDDEIILVMYVWFVLRAVIRTVLAAFLSCPPVYRLYFILVFYGQIKNEQEAFEKCWAHSPLRAASRPFTRCRYKYCRAPPAHRCTYSQQCWLNDTAPFLQTVMMQVPVTYRCLLSLGKISFSINARENISALTIHQQFDDKKIPSTFN